VVHSDLEYVQAHFSISPLLSHATSKVKSIYFAFELFKRTITVTYLQDL